MEGRQINIKHSLKYGDESSFTEFLFVYNIHEALKTFFQFRFIFSAGLDLKVAALPEKHDYWNYFELRMNAYMSSCEPRPKQTAACLFMMKDGRRCSERCSERCGRASSAAERALRDITVHPQPAAANKHHKHRKQLMCRGDELRPLLIGSELPQQRSVSMVPIQAQQVRERRGRNNGGSCRFSLHHAGMHITSSEYLHTRLSDFLQSSRHAKIRRRRRFGQRSAAWSPTLPV